MNERAGAVPGRRVWSVSALIAAVAEAVDAGFPACTVRGEISGFSRAASGHCYFNLKDPDGSAALRCAMFRRAAQLAGWLPRDGDAVELRGRLGVYEPRGELHLVYGLVPVLVSFAAEQLRVGAAEAVLSGRGLESAQDVGKLPRADQGLVVLAIVRRETGVMALSALVVFGLAVRAYAGLKLPEKHPVVHNLVISNVPGPPVPLYFMGARVEGLYPLGPVFHGAGLNITVMSNNGQLHVGIIACRESMPDVDDLTQRFPAELDRLQKAVSERSLVAGR